MRPARRPSLIQFDRAKSAHDRTMSTNTLAEHCGRISRERWATLTKDERRAVMSQLAKKRWELWRKRKALHADVTA